MHLRGGAVARGGIRWSDRREDFRTEVLGLMKAQMVKNAVIVPVGAKGGFVVKRPPARRDELPEEVIACYQTFIRGLLDLTDDIDGGEVVPPTGVVRYDGDDPYLVVAADKGTATFSDIANGIALEEGFWLGDAFASGGSTGYDHKEMGITARGAWESVKRHFRELDRNVQTDDFTVVGVGDMSGDVFGNGMLLSPHIRLVGAFNHRHVFLDPNPDPERSFEERRRLFELPASSWDDYDRDAISAGGGVYDRAAKSVRLSPEAREALGIEDESLKPNELIQALLRAPVDLLWNGGIGTYVKAGSESHADAGDKANDAVRVDASELRAKVVGEGGNLGVTQRGRIEYALAGGRINTDAIDNSGGVDCSDREVNIKILLDAVVEAGDLTEKQRNSLLAEMSDAVAALVLQDNYEQTETLSLAEANAASMVDVHQRFLRFLESRRNLNRELEALPDDEEIGERKRDDGGLTRPEIAVLLAYSKIDLYEALLESDVPEDPYLSAELDRYFPAPLPERFGEQMRSHRLGRQIVATQVVNNMLHGGGTTFAFRLHEETGAPASQIARAYACAREIFEMRPLWAEIEQLDTRCAAQVQIDLLLEGRRLVERASRWLLGHRPRQLDIASTVRHFRPGAMALVRVDHTAAVTRGRRAARAPRRRAARAGRARGPRDPRGRPPDDVRGARHRDRRRRDRPRRGPRGRRAFPAREPPRAALAARPDRGAAARQPLARPCARGAARRHLRHPPRADLRGAARVAGGRRHRRDGGRLDRLEPGVRADAPDARRHPQRPELRPHDAARGGARDAEPDRRLGRDVHAGQLLADLPEPARGLLVARRLVRLNDLGVAALLARPVGADVHPALEPRLGRGEQRRERAHLVALRDHRVRDLHHQPVEQRRARRSGGSSRRSPGGRPGSSRSSPRARRRRSSSSANSRFASFDCPYARQRK